KSHLAAEPPWCCQNQSVPRPNRTRLKQLLSLPARLAVAAPILASFPGPRKPSMLILIRWLRQNQSVPRPNRTLLHPALALPVRLAVAAPMLSSFPEPRKPSMLTLIHLLRQSHPVPRRNRTRWWGPLPHRLGQRVLQFPKQELKVPQPSTTEPLRVTHR